jgi:hypothetical protein
MIKTGRLFRLPALESASSISPDQVQRPVSPAGGLASRVIHPPSPTAHSPIVLSPSSKCQTLIPFSGLTSLCKTHILLSNSILVGIRSQSLSFVEVDPSSDA